MAQPEARFKRKLIESFERHVPGGWYTYLSHGGAGQKPGLNDQLFGDRNGGPARPLLWVEAKMWPIKMESTQRLTLNALRACGACVRIVASAATVEHPRGVWVCGITPAGLSQPLAHPDFKTLSFWDLLWSMNV